MYNGYLDSNMIRDLQINVDWYRDTMLNCVSNNIYNDFNNNTNMANTDNQYMLLHYNASVMSNCYRMMLRY